MLTRQELDLAKRAEGIGLELEKDDNGNLWLTKPGRIMVDEKNGPLTLYAAEERIETIECQKLRRRAKRYGFSLQRDRSKTGDAWFVVQSDIVSDGSLDLKNLAAWLDDFEDAARRQGRYWPARRGSR